MDWKTVAFLLISAGTLMGLLVEKLVFYFKTRSSDPLVLLKRFPRDLILLCGGALTLLIGITPAKEFMNTLTDGALLLLLSCYLLYFVIKEPLLDRSIKIKNGKDIVQFLPDEFWCSALSGVLFAAALKETLLPESVATLLFSIEGGSPFLLVGFVMISLYFIAQLLPAVFVLLAFFPISLEVLQHSAMKADVTVAAFLTTLFALLFSSLNVRTKEKFQRKVRLPVLLILFLLCTFLIPQLGLIP